MKKHIVWTLSAISIAAVGCGDAGGSGTTGTSNNTTGVALKMYQTEHPAVGYVDANGGLHSNIRPGQLESYGGNPSSGYSYTVKTGTSMPFPALIIDPLTGLVHGTFPSGTTAGQYPYSVTVSDGSHTYNSIGAYIQVNSCNSSGAGGGSNCNDPPPMACNSGTLFDINLAGLAAYKAAEPVGFSLTVSGGVPPYKNWTVLTGSLPPGTTLDASRGVLYGTPLSSAAGQTYTFTVRVSDANNQLCPATGASPATYKIAF